MTFPLGQALDLKQRRVAGVKLSTRPYPHRPDRLAQFAGHIFVVGSSLHTFCGKECAQARLCELKWLIRFRLRRVLVFVAHAALLLHSPVLAFCTLSVDKIVRKRLELD
jgi:hypothetical protein